MFESAEDGATVQYDMMTASLYGNTDTEVNKWTGGERDTSTIFTTIHGVKTIHYSQCRYYRSEQINTVVVFAFSTFQIQIPLKN